MEKFKQEMIQRFVKYGKRHRKLKAPVIAILAVCLTTYYMVREAGHKLLRNRFRRRLVCVMMAAVILFAQTEITGVFVLAQDSGTAAAAVAGFEELPRVALKSKDAVSGPVPKEAMRTLPSVLLGLHIYATALLTVALIAWIFVYADAVGFREICGICIVVRSGEALQ